jgi:heterodisulfide reductase subunit A
LLKIGVYVCHCGLNIAGVVDAKSVAEYAAGLPDVKVARDSTYTCSDAAQKLIKDDILNEGLNRIVVASCSPRMHEETFRKAISEAGLNPYLLEMVNIREQDSWVHSENPAEATEKAKILIEMAVARSRLLSALQRKKIKASRDVLVIGGGIAGIQSALDLAEAGFKVYLVEKTPSIGGRMAQLDKTFPTLDCSACILTPKMAELGRHPNVQLFTYSEVENVAGFVGNYEVTVRKNPRYIDEASCTACGECVKVCPVLQPNEFDQGLTKRTAIYRPFPQAVPNVFTIDKKGTPPCRAACPAGVNIQGYIALASQGKFREAYELIKKTIPFPSVCGRVCFHPCESMCKRGEVDEPIAINAIKRFVSDYVAKSGKVKENPPEQKNPEKIAIVGAGPAGLTAAHHLAKSGYPVTVFESQAEAGGMLRNGIPKYRLPRSILDDEIKSIEEMGVEIKVNSAVQNLMKLKQNYQAILIATGLQEAKRLQIQGEELKGVVPALNFLKARNLGVPFAVGKKVAVIGGGNVAVDAARSLIRSGCDNVTLLYRRTREEMPAYSSEVEECEKEGVQLSLLVAPTKILGESGRVRAVECVRMRLGDPDETGRRRPIPIEGSEFILEVDMVVPAIGQKLDTAPFPEELALTTHDTIEADPVTLETSLSGVFAVGDAMKGEAMVIDAIAQGIEAAVSIDRYLQEKDLRSDRVKEVTVADQVSTEGVEKRARKEMPRLHVSKRQKDEEVELGFTEEMVLQEASRCLACGGCSECLECEKVCELEGVINHDQKAETLSLNVGAIIVAVGCDVFDASLVPELGYGQYGNVISNLEFERFCNAAGPTEGKIVNPITGKPPRSVAFIQCVGSRDKRFNEHCCRVGCMATLKHALLLKDKLGENVDVYVCYNDMRTFGKGYEEFYGRARQRGVRFVKGLPSEVRGSSDDSLNLDVFESAAGKLLTIEADLVVLASGLVPSENFQEIQNSLRISRSADGFFLETHPKLQPLETPTRGIYLAGTCQSPKDIPDTVAQASGAAMKVAELLATGEVEIEPLIANVDENLCSGCEICQSICPYSAIEMETRTDKGEEHEVAKVLEAVCQGCGACSTACPTKAIDMQHYTQEQILAQLTVAIQGGKRK